MLPEWWGRARLSLWEGEPREPAKPERKGNSGGASQGQLPLNKALPSLRCPSLLPPFEVSTSLLFPASSFCLCLLLPFVHPSFLPSLFSFISSLSCATCIEAHTKWLSTPNSLLWGFIPTTD